MRYRRTDQIPAIFRYFSNFYSVSCGHHSLSVFIVTCHNMTGDTRTTKSMTDTGPKSLYMA